jgi:hypothetical protein
LPRTSYPDPLFVDFEASGLHLGSFPVEVGWASSDGISEVHLIRPTAAWLHTPWDPQAERIHGINLDRLLIVGEPVQTVATRLRDAAVGHRLYSNDVGHDERWLRSLLREAGNENPDALKLWCANILFRDLASDRGVDLAAVRRLASQRVPVTHRADDDARHLAEAYRLLSDGNPSALKEGTMLDEGKRTG